MTLIFNRVLAVSNFIKLRAAVHELAW